MGLACVATSIAGPVEVITPGENGLLVPVRDEAALAEGESLIRKTYSEFDLQRLRDQFGHQRLREGKYTPGQIDQRWSDEMEKDFSKWLNDHIDKLPVPRARLSCISVSGPATPSRSRPWATWNANTRCHRSLFSFFAGGWVATIPCLKPASLSVWSVAATAITLSPE